MALGAALLGAAIAVAACGGTPAPTGSSASPSPAADPTASPRTGALESQSRPDIIAAGSQLAVVVATIHRPSHTTYASTFAGVPIHVAATVAGAFGTPTGTVQSRVYSNGTCSGFIEGESSPTALSGGSVDITAFTYAQNDSGAMSWIVHYSGNATYAARDSACVAITVLKVGTSVTTVVHDPAHVNRVEVPLGTSVHPKATVAGALDTPTGSVRLRWWQNGNCFSTASLTYELASLVNGAVDMTAFVRPSTSLGSRSFRVEYLGDSTYEAKAGPCVEYVVVKANPTLGASIHDASHEPNTFVAVGKTVHPAVNLSGSVGTPTGSVEISRWNGSTCSGTPVKQTVSAASSIDPAGSASTRDTPGFVSWQVRYLGDAKYAARTSACLHMQWKAIPTINAVVHTAAHQDGTVVPPGTAVHLRVTASGSAGTVTGQVVTYYYGPGTTCPGNGGLNQGGGPLSAQVFDDANADVAIAVEGTYRLVAVYQGDANYAATRSDCETFTVVVPPTLPPPVTPAPIVTPPPTKAPTPPPANAPTPPPGATAAPGTTASASAAPGATAAPGSTGAAIPGLSSGPGGSGGPEASVGAASPAPGSTPPAPGSSAGPTATSGPSTPSGSGEGPGSVGLLLLLLVLVLGGGLAFVAYRRRQPAADAEIR